MGSKSVPVGTIPRVRLFFMQLRIYTAYAATLLCSPFMRSCFCAVMLFYADEAFTQSRFYAAEPFTQAHFTQLRYLCGHAFCAVLDGNGSQGERI